MLPLRIRRRPIGQLGRRRRGAAGIDCGKRRNGEGGGGNCWRRRWDSNPRIGDLQSPALNHLATSPRSPIADSRDRLSRRNPCLKSFICAQEARPGGWAGGFPALSESLLFPSRRTDVNRTCVSGSTRNFQGERTLHRMGVGVSFDACETAIPSRTAFDFMALTRLDAVGDEGLLEGAHAAYP